jgi:hypothetical protein
MAAIVRALSRAFPTTSIEADTLRNIAIFCGLGLLVSLCVASYGLDLNAGLF